MCIVNAHHKFVKTTPKPSATKNRSGDEVGPVPTFGLLEGDDAVVGDGDDCTNVLVRPESDDRVALVDGVSRAKT